jgi:hypothetical protein
LGLVCFFLRGLFAKAPSAPGVNPVAFTRKTLRLRREAPKTLALLKRALVWGLVALGAALLVAVSGCGDDDGPGAATDGGTGDAGASDGAVPMDGASDEDAATDGGDGCTPVEILGSWMLERADDVSIGFAGALMPVTSGTTSQVVVLFERYVPEPPVGTFELGAGDNGNYGTCRECVAVPGLVPERAFFADRGTLTTEVDPYLRRFRASLVGVRLIEVAVDPLTRECLALADVTVDQTFTPAGWTCADADYADGAACHCECGAYDPDCDGCDPFADPGCEPRPVADCDAADICAFHPYTDPGAPIGGETRCTEVCDWEARTACDRGVCVYSFGGIEAVDTCFEDPARLDEAAVGEDCGVGFLQKACAVAGGFATGFCDESNRCRPICSSDAECTADGESCRRFSGGDEGLGYCGGPPVDG